jgi:hypothetical protein
MRSSRTTSATRTWALLVAVCVSASLSGCTALRLSSRGAPDEGRRELGVVLQAVDLPMQTTSHRGQPQPAPVWVTFPESGWLHNFRFSVIDHAGDSVPRGVLHHLKVIAPERRELFSPIPLHLVGAGEETTPVDLPKEVGYHFEAGDSLLVTAMLHNPTDQDLRGVTIELTLGYSTEGTWRPPMDVVPFFAHVAPVMDVASYDLPPGRSTRSVDIVPAISGEVLGIGAHLHRYGVSLSVDDVTDGRSIWTTEAKLAPDGTVIDIPRDRFVWSRGPRLRADHTYRVTAVFDNPTGAVIADGGMATVGGVIIPDEEWPEVDREAVEYQWYLERELQPPAAPDHGHH